MVEVTTTPTLASFKVRFDEPDHAATIANVLDHGLAAAADHPHKGLDIRFDEDTEKAH